MRTALWIAVGILAVGESVAMAQGVPSQEKMSRLGLSSMKVATDDAGQQVRGSGFGAYSITFTLTASDTSTPPNTSTVTGTQSFAFGQHPKTVGASSFGGIGFGGFVDSANPNFANFTNTPLTTNTTVTGNLFVSSIQGFAFGFGR